MRLHPWFGLLSLPWAPVLCFGDSRQCQNGNLAKCSALRKDIHPTFYPESKVGADWVEGGARTAVLLALRGCATSLGLCVAHAPRLPSRLTPPPLCRFSATAWR
jgi:hypothetical protein